MVRGQGRKHENLACRVPITTRGLLRVSTASSWLEYRVRADLPPGSPVTLYRTRRALSNAVGPCGPPSVCYASARDAHNKAPNLESERTVSSIEEATVGSSNRIRELFSNKDGVSGRYMYGGKGSGFTRAGGTRETIQTRACNAKLDCAPTARQHGISDLWGSRLVVV